MKISKVIPSGYCKGVIMALQKVVNAVHMYPNEKIYVLGMIVHNRYIVEALDQLGVITLQDKDKTKWQLLEEIENGVIIFTAHGVDPKLIDYAKEKGLIVIDATCPDVEKNAQLVKQYLSKGYDVFYIGKKNHPESEAVTALSDHIHLITRIEDLDGLHLENPDILITNQTTMSVLEIQSLIEQIRQRYPKAVVAEEICSATRMRQHALTILEGVDTVVVVGDPTSNNTTQLANTAKNSGIEKVYKVQCAQELCQYDFTDCRHIAVTAGASTPNYLTQQVIEYLSTQDPQYLNIEIDQILKGLV